MKTSIKVLTSFLAPVPVRRPPSSTPVPYWFTALTRRHRTMATSSAAKRLEGKTILVTGASSGIGRSTALEFARTAPRNLKLILTARRIDALRQLAADIKAEVGDGVQVLPVQLDVSNVQEVKQFVPNLPAEFKEIDVLVNNASVAALITLGCRGSFPGLT